MAALCLGSPPSLFPPSASLYHSVTTQYHSITVSHATVRDPHRESPASGRQEPSWYPGCGAFPYSGAVRVESPRTCRAVG